MKRRRFTPYALMSPGLLWLLVFFVVPMYFMGVVSLESGSIDTGFSLTWAFVELHDAITDYPEQFERSFLYGGIATLLGLLIAYPLAYAIAFRARPLEALLLFAVVAPFFTTYLIRTLAWQTILADQSPLVDVAQLLRVVPDDGRVLDTAAP